MSNKLEINLPKPAAQRAVFLELGRALRMPGGFVSRVELKNAIEREPGDVSSERRNIDYAVWAIRQLLRSEDPSIRIITRPGFGYVVTRTEPNE